MPIAAAPRRALLPAILALLGVSAPPAEAAAEPLRLEGRRQLFLDDHVIARREHLTRRVQPVVKHPENPLILRGADFEGLGVTFPSVLWDEEERLFKCWVDALGRGVFYLTSRDGVHWERPRLGLFPEFDAEPNHRVVLSGYEFAVKDAPPDKLAYLRGREAGWKYFCNLGGVLKDPRDPDPARRYKMTYLWIDRAYVRAPGAQPGKMTGLGVAFSPDGIRWTPVNQPVSQATFDCPIHTIWDERARKWVMLGRVFGVTSPGHRARHGTDPNLKHNAGRAVIRIESDDFVRWTPAKGELVMAADEADSAISEIYSLRPIPYEGLQIGLVHLFHNEPGDVRLYFQLAVSRDGRSWTRLEDRSAFIPLGGLGDWDRSTHMPPSSDPLLVGDEIRFYYSGRNVPHPTRWKLEDDSRDLMSLPPYRGGIGLATIRRDRFVALEASLRPGTLRTKPFVAEGRTLHVNASTRFGALRIALLDEAGTLLQRAEVPAGDATDVPVRSLTALAGQTGRPVSLEFTLQNGRLFSFWLD